MTHQMNLDLLSQLFAEIERAWLDNHDRTIVYTLSNQHPDLREQLYEFFEDMVLEPERQPSAEISDAEERVTQWLQACGLNIAISAAAQSRASTTTTSDTTATPLSATERPANDKLPTETREKAANWLIFLRRHTKEAVPNLTSRLNHVTTEYLVLISRHPDVVPMNVKTRIAQDVERVWRIPLQESLYYLEGKPSVVRAASRSRPFEKDPATFEELLDRSALTPEQKDFWLQYSDSNR
jgi:hypothetical protein